MKFLKQMRLRRKFKILCIGIVCIPMMLLGIFSYSHTKHLLLKNQTDVLQNTFSRATEQLCYDLRNYEDISRYIINNEDFLTSVNTDYTEQPFLIYQTETYSLAPLLKTYLLLNEDMLSISIYTNCGLTQYHDIIYKLSKLEEYNWFDSVKNNYLPSWHIDTQSSPSAAVCIRRLMQTPSYPFTNYLSIKVNYNKLFASLQNLIPQSYDLIVLDENNQCIYSNSPNEAARDIVVNRIRFSPASSQNKYLKFHETLNPQKWNIYFQIPSYEIYKEIHATLFVVIILIVFFAILILSSTYYMINQMLKPLETLTASTEQLRNGSFDIYIETKRTDELGILINSFNEMVKKIRYLIDEVYKNQIEIKEYQLKVLLAQINPHFLYNSLALINNKAILANQDDISEMTLLLSDFYRFSLNHGKYIGTIESEIKNIKTYLAIQQILYENHFSIQYDIDDKLISCEIPNLILQPIVENALEHGLSLSSNPDKQLKIKVSYEQNEIQISVYDNGIGIKKEVLPDLLYQESKHFGLKNVNERLILSYGPEYGLNITSEPGAFTCVIVRVPL